MSGCLAWKSEIFSKCHRPPGLSGGSLGRAIRAPRAPGGPRTVRWGPPKPGGPKNFNFPQTFRFRSRDPPVRDPSQGSLPWGPRGPLGAPQSLEVGENFNFPQTFRFRSRDPPVRDPSREGPPRGPRGPPGAPEPGAARLPGFVAGTHPHAAPARRALSGAPVGPQGPRW